MSEPDQELLDALSALIGRGQGDQGGGSAT